MTNCYIAGTTQAGDCAASTANDRGDLQWRRDNTQYETSTFTYDTQGRVKKQQGTYDGGSAASTYQYTYDNRGNRTSATPAPNSDTGSQSLTFNAANQITTSGYSYDGAGNLTADPASSTTNITYTAADQVASGTKDGQTWTLKHAGVTNNELIEQDSIDGKYRYTYGRSNGAGLPVVEQMTRTVVQNGTTNTYNTTFVNDPLTGQPLLQRLSSGQTNMYVYNGTPGAPIALIATNSQVGMAERYDPYGVPVITDGFALPTHEENPYTFGGGGVYMRITGWVHYGARYYSTITGTFTQQDTLDAPLDPADGNRYAFAGGDRTAVAAGCRHAAPGGDHAGPRPGPALGEGQGPGRARGPAAAAAVLRRVLDRLAGGDRAPRLDRALDPLGGGRHDEAAPAAGERGSVERAGDLGGRRHLGAGDDRGALPSPTLSVAGRSRAGADVPAPS